MKYEKEYSVVIQFLARDLLIVLVHVMIFFNFYSGQSSITRIIGQKSARTRGNKRNKQNSTRMSAPLTL